VTVELTELRPGVALLRLSRPDALNTLNREMVRALHAALDKLEADRDTRVVVFTGAGRAFCAGFDLNGYGDEDEIARLGETVGFITRQDEISDLVLRLHRLPQPVIAALNGPTAGAGLSLAVACDIRIATAGAVFSAAFLRAGYTGCDLGSSWLLPRLVGVGRAHELILTARRFDAEEALRIGLVTDVVPVDALLARAEAVAAEILLGPPLSVELTKRGLWAGVESPSLANSMDLENRLQVLMALTEDQPEATRAYLEKRTPCYRRR
jgi:enoyl-CoA hydratase